MSSAMTYTVFCKIDLMEKRVWYLPFFVLIPRFINSASVCVRESDSWKIL